MLVQIYITRRLADTVGQQQKTNS